MPPSVQELAQARGTLREESRVVRGYISTNRPAPTGFPTVGGEENLVWVVLPEQTLDRVVGPCWWSADHGATLPAPGAACVVMFDNTDTPWVVAWQGNHS